jgi:two-component system response regulator MprA
MRRILVVDESPAIRALYRHILASVESVSVRYANDGAEALAEIQTYAPELVFLDVDMPDLDGLEVLWELGATGWLDRLHVVLVSAAELDENTGWVKLAGAVDRMRKPFPARELLARVDWLVPATHRITVRPGRGR